MVFDRKGVVLWRKGIAFDRRGGGGVMEKRDDI